MWAGNVTSSQWPSADVSSVFADKIEEAQEKKNNGVIKEDLLCKL
jgi:hypothetical protein